MNLEGVKQMKKSELKQILNKAVNIKALNNLQKLKKSHSKVMNVKHFKIGMQEYLKAGKSRIKQEVARRIFKLRSRVTDVKINFRGKFESLECDLCKEVDENQEHLLQCKEILKNREGDTKQLKYENIFEHNVKNQAEIAEQFEENIKLRKKILKPN